MTHEARYFAETLKDLRLRAGLSGRALGKMADLSTATVCAIERRGNPRWNVAVALAKALGVPMSIFIPPTTEDVK